MFWVFYLFLYLPYVLSPCHVIQVQHFAAFEIRTDCSPKNYFHDVDGKNQDTVNHEIISNVDLFIRNMRKLLYIQWIDIFMTLR
jgi:hypothetical protein